jgi:hypothetical protein
LNNLHTNISDSVLLGIGKHDSSWQWRKYFTDQTIRGYLGDQSAIAGLDTVIKFYPDDSDGRKLTAIGLLADAGYYNYFDILKSKYPDGYLVFGLYEKDARYRNEVRTILETALRNNATNKGNRWFAAKAIATFDKPLAIKILNEIYHTMSGYFLRDVFIDLNLMDPDGSPERIVEALMKEPNSKDREDYYPVPGEVEEGSATKRYYEPWFIKFTRDWLDKDTSHSIQYFVGRWLNSFIPLQPDSTVSVLKQIDNLIGLKDTVANYHWIGGNISKMHAQIIYQMN